MNGELLFVVYATLSYNEDLLKSETDYAQTRSIRSFLTLALLIISGSQSGAFAPFGTLLFEPENTCTLFVPLSLRWMSVTPLEAAFKAAPLGCLLWNT